VLSRERPFFMRNSLDVYTLSPEEFKLLLESNGVRVDRIVGKLFTMPLGLHGQKMIAEDCTEEFLDRIMQIELHLASRPDSISLGSHFQAFGYKQP